MRISGLEAVRRLVDRAALASSRVLEDQGVGRDGVDLDHEIAGLASDAEPHLVRQRLQRQLVARAPRRPPGEGLPPGVSAVTARQRCSSAAPRAPGSLQTRLTAGPPQEPLTPAGRPALDTFHPRRGMHGRAGRATIPETTRLVDAEGAATVPRQLTIDAPLDCTIRAGALDAGGGPAGRCGCAPREKAATARSPS